MGVHLLSYSNGFYFSPSNSSKITLACNKPTSIALTFLRKKSSPANFILSSPKPNFQVVEAVRFDGPVFQIEDMLAFERCITRSLAPALTLEEGLDRIKEAIESFKLNPPSTPTGIFRFQVAVPPSPKALNWFCRQPESSSAFPLIFISKNTDNPAYKSLLLNGNYGVFGIGAAVYFKHSSSNSVTKSLIKRHVLNDSTTHMVAYGFLDINIDSDLLSITHEDGSYYFFVPQIELDEQLSVSFLTATLAWDEISLCTYEEALHALEISLNQAIYHTCPTTEKSHLKYVHSALKILNLAEDGPIQMVYMINYAVGARESITGNMELKDSQCCSQFCVRFSPHHVVASNMLRPGGEFSGSVKENLNINAVWASLLVEECSRLGLTYFCIAPGSRSSPLAVAASIHPLITSISCFDERSLAFHAVGYGRGSRCPAVIVTSSGTAVSNLLPAVVEASHDFVPLVLLTADRPPELQDAGANQSINQANHFGSFVRFFFSLPPPTDQILARVVLTTLDSAVHWATSSPCGPVHVNCPFREPLDNSPGNWMRSCLKGLELWMSSFDPFTKYIHMQQSYTCNNDDSQMLEILNLIKGAGTGLLVLGAIHTEDEIWAALLLAKHLSWPVVADILSGLRLRKLVASFSEIEGNFMFVDCLDHALLSDSVKAWVKIDVVIQIGSRITSKRISQMLEDSFPCSYILVDKHPHRHDPSHIVTHRIQSCIINFAGCLLKARLPHEYQTWATSLQVLSMMVEREILFQICAENSLTEPQVAYVISEALSSDSALFLGNSMPIRDADMYGCNWSTSCQNFAAMMASLNLPYHGIRVTSNRGASGIDGLLSTAVGLAVGCSQRVFCVIGDVSFLHDTNGLVILKQRKLRKPMAVLVINNHGGAIFSLLPIADRIEPQILHQYFYTSHDISISGLCAAHGVKHLRVQTSLELEDALLTTRHEELDIVIEIDSSIDINAKFHRTLKNFSLQTAEHALMFLSRLFDQTQINSGFCHCKIHKLKYSQFRISLCAPPTSESIDHNHAEFYRCGFILSLYLEDGSFGLGEVSPLGIHRENEVDVEDQLKFLVQVMKGAKISCFVPLLKGSFSNWIWNELGIPPFSMFPSVRCGLEMAILNAIAHAQASSLLTILHPQTNGKDITENALRVRISALIDSDGTPADVACAAIKLVEEGFSTIKVKVARHGTPMHSGKVIQEIRKKVGPHIEIRADANRRWTYKEAMEFSSFVKECNLQYIEEPVHEEDDILKFTEESGLPVALDETISNIQEDPLKGLLKYAHPGIVAVVIKPSIVGGFETASLIAKWAQQLGKMAVVSAAFESSIGLSTFVQFSCYIEMQNVDICKVMQREVAPPMAHGLGTYRWLKQDVTIDPLKIDRNSYSGFVEASVTDASQLLHSFQVNPNVILRNYSGNQLHSYQWTVELKNFSFIFNVQELKQKTDDNVIVFLHGFLGTAEEWIDIMNAISESARCISVDLPGHGRSRIQKHGVYDCKTEPCLSMELVVNALIELIHRITPAKVTIVGYSMGARIALYMALMFADKIRGAAIISGSPGLKDSFARKVRMAKDDSRACALLADGLQSFLEAWYAEELWTSLREHPHFNHIVASRLQHDDLHGLAEMLSGLSIGRQIPLWEDLKSCRTPLLLMFGEKDPKFKKIAEEMMSALLESGHDQQSIYEMLELPHCGHAAHLENPLSIIYALRQFMRRL